MLFYVQVYHKGVKISQYLLVLLVVAALAGFGGYLRVNSRHTQATTLNPLSCGDFKALSDFVLSNITKPDSTQDKIDFNPYNNGFRWRRTSGEPFIIYPAVASLQANYIQFDYDKNVTLHPDTYLMQAIKDDSVKLSSGLLGEAEKLGMKSDPLNTFPFIAQNLEGQKSEVEVQDYTYQEVFGFRKGDNLYSVILSSRKDYQAPGNGTVVVVCGNATALYDHFYDALGLKANLAYVNPFENYVGILEVSKDLKVYETWGGKGDDAYYIFDGKTPEKLSFNISPIDCYILESRKVGKGLQCTQITNNDPNNFQYVSRVVTY